MGLFSANNPFDSHVERATNEKNTSDDWAQIMDVCDRVKEVQNGPKDCLKAITKRLGNDNPRVALQAITLLDACINNCGRKFLLEVAGREFEQELLRFITSHKTHPKLASRLKESLKLWAEGDFKNDPELGLITALYAKLQKEGIDFSDSEESPRKAQVSYSNDPNVVSSQQEEDDIAKAIQLSLQEKGSNSYSSPKSSSGYSSNLYSNASATLSSSASPPPLNTQNTNFSTKDQRKVRALYDFEAAEDNELSFKAGEIILIIDDSDANWWKGSNHHGEGLFPANFVTKDLDEPIGGNSQWSGKHVSFSDCVEVAEVETSIAETEAPTGEIDEDTVDRLLHLLHEADPTGERTDDPGIAALEEQVNAMAPSIDTELENIDKRHSQLARVSTDLMDALNLYHQLMRDMPMAGAYYSPYKGIPQSLPNVPPTYSVNTPLQQLPSQPMYHPPHLPFGHYGALPQGEIPSYNAPGHVDPSNHGVSVPPASSAYSAGGPSGHAIPPNAMPPHQSFHPHAATQNEFHSGIASGPDSIANPNGLQASELPYAPPAGPYGHISYPHPVGLPHGGGISMVMNQGAAISSQTFPAHVSQGAPINMVTSIPYSHPSAGMGPSPAPHPQAMPHIVSSMHQPIQ